MIYRDLVFTQTIITAREISLFSLVKNVPIRQRTSGSFCFTAPIMRQYLRDSLRQWNTVISLKALTHILNPQYLNVCIPGDYNGCCPRDLSIETNSDN